MRIWFLFAWKTFDTAFSTETIAVEADTVLHVWKTICYPMNKLMRPLSPNAKGGNFPAYDQRSPGSPNHPQLSPALLTLEEPHWVLCICQTIPSILAGAQETHISTSPVEGKRDGWLCFTISLITTWAGGSTEQEVLHLPAHQYEDSLGWGKGHTEQAKHR